MARLFGCCLAGAWLVAWWSIGIQLLPLVGHDGLLPASTFFAQAQAHHDASFFTAPSHLWWVHDDVALLLTVVCGLVSASASLVSLWPRRMLMVSAGLYVSLAAPLGSFFPMLPDRLLLEATLVALLLSRDQPRPYAHWLARLLVIKLYLHVGASQWLAPHNEWQNGLALGSFFVTTPLPTPLSWWLVHLPAAALALGTKLVLLVELFAPFCLLGPRPMRLLAAVALTTLQVLALFLVNYGLFAFVAVSLHLFFLDERDVDAIAHDLGRIATPLGNVATRLFGAPQHRTSHDVPVAVSLQLLHGAILSVYIALGLASFWEARHRFGRLTEATQPVAQALGHWQLVHSYTHLASPAGVRAEPLFERLVAGEWQAVELWRQPNDPFRAPSFVAPHLPRLDVSLSSWGQQVYAALHPASGEGGALAQGIAKPPFVAALLTQLCDAQPGIQRLLRTSLAHRAQAVRLKLYRYDIAPVGALRTSGLWWTRAEVASLAEMACPSAP